VLRRGTRRGRRCEPIRPETRGVSATV